MSALRGEGLPELMQAIMWEAELADLQAEVGGAAEGVVLESRRDPRQGATLSLIVRKGAPGLTTAFVFSPHGQCCIFLWADVRGGISPCQQ
jgi:translation initiation factor IF-2